MIARESIQMSVDSLLLELGLFTFSSEEIKSQIFK